MYLQIMKYMLTIQSFRSCRKMGGNGDKDNENGGGAEGKVDENILIHFF